MKVLFVCTGNTCRSPMAEALLKHKSHFEVKSAGVFAASGSPASPQSVEVLKEHNIECNHESAPLNQELVEWADLILTMTHSHKELVVQTYPDASNKVYTLKEYVYSTDQDQNESLDIQDPFGGSIERYKEAMKEIEDAIDQLIEKLMNEKDNE